ncbi:MAG: urease accessory protein UreD [Cyanobacteria bacterium]|nr:urease accessory protein UreD [Cyanobacteriota bacterium]MDA1247041.1 urease accessory protein UreD [Cyanobacteriota bacterium]
MEFTARQGPPGEAPVTVHQGWATSPLKLQRAYPQADGRCELPLLHTAGGLVGGDQLTLRVHLAPGSQALLTSAAAQKVYGTVGRSRLMPQGQWAQQNLHFSLEAGSDLEWMPQELVLFAGGLLEQNITVELAAGASWLGMDVVRLGRSAAGETLGQGCWRSRLQVCRLGPEGRRWELVDPLEIRGASLATEHGMAGQPVLGSLVWAAPQPLMAAALAQLLTNCRSDRQGLEGHMACGALDQGLIARYRGPSSQAARFWFTRVWARIRAARGLTAPELPRVWPFQEQPLGSG